MVNAAMKLRIRHALRVAIGAAMIQSLTIQLPITIGCGASFFFYISTIAGTPESFEGFQLSSATLTFWGVVIAAFSSSIIIAISGSSAEGAFFCTLPLIIVFAFFRTDRSLLPLPIVATLYTGFTIISKLGIARSQVPSMLGAILLDAICAYTAAIFVNTVLLPDRAADEGRHILASHIRDLGAGLSAAGSRVFSNASHRHIANAIPPVESADTIESDLLHCKSKSNGEGSDSTVVNREQSCNPNVGVVHKIRPFGYTQLDSYQNLTRAEQLLSVASCEPSFLPGKIFRWRNNGIWKDIVSYVCALTNTVASLESAVTAADHSGLNFSRKSALQVFGEAYFPLWKAHFAACAAACSTMAHHMRNDSCRDMFCISKEGDVRQNVKEIHRDIDPRQWKKRRAEMYMGMLLRFQSKWCHLVEGYSSPFLKREDAFKSEDSKLSELTEPRALIFFAQYGHAVAEEIEHVQKAMAEMAQSKSRKSWKALFYFNWMPFSRIRKRCKQLVEFDVHAWELRFVFTQSLMLLSLLALSLFLPLRENIKGAELAWIFTSAVLCTRLTAEPTLFIGVYRVCGTVMGAALAVGAEYVLEAIGRPTNQALQYLLVPFLFLVTVGSLLIFPPTHRYVAFLTILTTSVVSFCPQGNTDCIPKFVSRVPECYTDMRFALSRASSVSIGVVCALVFHFIFWPRFAQREARDLLSKAFLYASRLFTEQYRIYFRGDCLHGESNDFPPAVNNALPMDSPASPKIWNEHERLHKTLDMGDVFTNAESEMSRKINRDVDCRLRGALVLIGDASVWNRGPMKIGQMLPVICDDFVSLAVSLHQMAKLLHRVPLLSGAYGRSVYDRYIAPCLYQFETVQISLHNMASTASRALTEGSRRNLENSRSDLVWSVNHLTESREKLAKAIQMCGTALINEGSESGRPPLHSDDLVTTNLHHRELTLGARRSNCREADVLSPAMFDLKRSTSFDENILRSDNEGADLLQPDDAVLFVSFSFAATSSLNACSRIVRHILADIDQVLESQKKGEKMFILRLGRPSRMVENVLRALRMKTSSERRSRRDL